MSSIWGRNIKVSLFGESHGDYIGVSINGLPEGFNINIEKINLEMRRRAPGFSSLDSPRKEDDIFKIISGYFNSMTTGTPLSILIENTNKNSRDYNKNIPRPSHGDYTSSIKYNSFNDYRGGGHFSARLTAPLVFAGAIAKQILEEEDIMIASRIFNIGNIKDEKFDYNKINKNTLLNFTNEKIPLSNTGLRKEIEDLILETKKKGDSVGGSIETFVLNLPIGLGDPYFDSIESILSSLIFSIPGVKSLEFGIGLDFSKGLGSELNDEIYVENKKIKTYTNNNGGILGGISNGMPLFFKTGFKPTPSIFKEQRSIDMITEENISISLKGRHDPCIVLRAIPVVEASCALAILDLLLERKKYAK